MIFSRVVGSRREFGKTGLLIVGYPQGFGFARHFREKDRINDGAGKLPMSSGISQPSQLTSSCSEGKFRS
jgi:hypothetical protein